MDVAFVNELIKLIDDMDEDLMAFYQRWQDNRDFEGYHKSVQNSDMRSVRKYVEDFREIRMRLGSMMVISKGEEVNLEYINQKILDAMVPELKKFGELIEILKRRDIADEVDQWILEVREMCNAWEEE